MRVHTTPRGCGHRSPLAHLVAGPGFEPGTFGLCVPLQLSLSPVYSRSLWSGLYLDPVTRACLRDEGPRRLVSTPSPRLHFALLDNAKLGGLGSVLPVKAPPNLTGVTRSFLTGQPIGQQIPTPLERLRPRSPLPFVRLHQADATTIAGEDLDRHHVTDPAVRYVQDCEIEIFLLIPVSTHPAPVGFRPPSVDGIQVLRALIPGALDLYAKERAAAVNGQVVWETIPHRLKHSEPPSQEFRHDG